MESICKANCEECLLYKNKKCEGCTKTKGCPFGKKCWIAKYIETGGYDKFNDLKHKLIDEINSLNIDGMPKIDELYALPGQFVNLEYQLPNNTKVKFLDDRETFLGNEVRCIYNSNDYDICYGIIANTSFIMVAEYGVGGDKPELLIYKKR